MIRSAIACLAALAALAGCGTKGDEHRTAAANRDAAAAPAAAPRPPPPGPAPQLSSEFGSNEAIPRQFTCDGAGTAPPLDWSEPVDGTRSFALIVDDPDAPSGTFHHWGIYDIPATTRAILNGQAPGRALINDFGKPGYGAPCPPKGSGSHHYRFKLYGLKVDHLPLKANASIADLQAAVLGNSRSESMLIGLYERK
jgi:Raf kinase inhibitor-like YbhB/YbcL family protein